MQELLTATDMLDFANDGLQKLIAERGWRAKSESEKVTEIYNFVRDEIAFGYNVDDAIPASRVLKDGYGQCNTKGTLLMALLRGVGVPCRLHGFTIDKKLQKGAMTGLVYKLAPRDIIHSWVEVLCDGRWYNLEGFILDQAYLSNLQTKFAACAGGFCGYGVAVDDFRHPIIDFNANDTYIQKEGINHDYGVFATPDEFFAKHRQKLNAIKRFLFRNFGRKLMNRNVKKIRK